MGICASGNVGGTNGGSHAAITAIVHSAIRMMRALGVETAVLGAEFAMRAPSCVRRRHRP
jgi:hypothetical protein